MLFVLDASAILNEPNFEFEKQHSYITTPLVFREFKSMESRLLVENALKHGLLEVRSPKHGFFERAQLLVEEHGYKISRADVSVLALSLELQDENREFVVLTDDFSIQNFLGLLGISYSSVIQGEIKEIFSFSKKCPVCGRVFHSSLKKCPACGVQLKSVLKKKKLPG